MIVIRVEAQPADSDGQLAGRVRARLREHDPHGLTRSDSFDSDGVEG